MTSLLPTSQTGTVDVPADYEELLNFVDTMERAARNANISAGYFRLLFSLFDTYPQILAGDRVQIEVWKVRENAASKERLTTNFFKDMNTISAFVYESIFRGKTNERESFVTATPNTPYPETFDANSVDRKRRAKAEEEKRRNQFKDPRKLWNCEVCGGELLYDATAHCKSCGHVHATIKDIPANEITIEAEVHEIADGDEDAWLNEWDTPTIEVQAVRAAPIVQQELPRPAAVTFGPSPRGIACPDCHSLNHWYAVPTEWGGTIYNCGVCMPPEDA